MSAIDVLEDKVRDCTKRIECLEEALSELLVGIEHSSIDSTIGFTRRVLSAQSALRHSTAGKFALEAAERE